MRGRILRQEKLWSDYPYIVEQEQAAVLLACNSLGPINKVWRIFKVLKLVFVAKKVLRYFDFYIGTLVLCPVAYIRILILTKGSLSNPRLTSRQRLIGIPRKPVDLHLTSHPTRRTPRLTFLAFALPRKRD